MSILLFLPVALLILGTIVLQFLRYSRLPAGTTWLILAGVVVFSWASMLVIRVHLSDLVVSSNWLPGSINADQIILQLDAKSWVFSFAFLSLLVGIVLTDTIQLDQSGNISHWTEVLLMTAIGLVAVMAGSPVAFILTWTFIDIVEIAVLTRLIQNDVISFQTVAAFGSRVLGTFFVLAAVILANSSGSPLALSDASGNVLVLLILGAGFRLGVLPLHLPYTHEVPLRRSLGTILRMVAPLTAFIFLSRLPMPDKISGWLVFVFILSIIASLFGSIKWFFGRDELEGRPYWLLAFSGFAMISALRGYSESVVSWGLIMLMVGGWIFLYSLRSRSFNFLIPLVVLGMIGIPFTPSAPALAGISVKPLAFFNPLFWVSLAFLVAGIIRHGMKSEELISQKENWMKLFYWSGLIILFISTWLTAIWQSSEWNGLQFLTAIIIVLLFLALILLITFSAKVKTWLAASQFGRIQRPFQRFWESLSDFFHFEWFYLFFSMIFNLIQKLINGFNDILEGEGGILWAFVFLALLVSLIASGRIG